MELISRNRNRDNEIKIAYSWMKSFTNNENLIQVFFFNTETRVYAAALCIFGGVVV
jgi:hypothetical protein